MTRGSSGFPKSKSVNRQHVIRGLVGLLIFIAVHRSPHPAMANVASQIILHPTASASLKVLGTTVGRDKVRNLCSHTPPRINQGSIGLPGDAVLCTILRVVSHFRRP